MTTQEAQLEYLRQRERALYAERMRARAAHEQAVADLNQAKAEAKLHPIMVEVLEIFRGKGGTP